MSDEPTCWWCPRPSEYLCDTLLLPEGSLPGVAFKSVEEAETCDAEMCSEHAEVALRGHGRMPEPDFICGGMTKKGTACTRYTPRTHSRCRQHSDQPKAEPVHESFESHRCPYCTKVAEWLLSRTEPADTHRAAARVQARRSQMGLVP